MKLLLISIVLKVLLCQTSSEVWVNGKPITETPVLFSPVKSVRCGKKRLGEFRGKIRVITQNGEKLVINEVDLEDYLASVVTAEMPPSYHPEALKAQAVASRTYAYYYYLKKRNDPFHLFSDERSQVYMGISSETPEARRAVKETRGEILTYRGEPILAMFFAGGSGWTEDYWEVFGGEPNKFPYLRATRCTCGEVRASEVKIKEETLRKIFPELGEVLNLQPLRRGKSGRISFVAVVGRNGWKKVNGLQLRKRLGLPSTQCEISVYRKNRRIRIYRIKRNYRRRKPSRVGGPSPTEFVFRCYGSGHGVGLDQRCANCLARKGYDYKRILMKFYWHVRLRKLKEQ